MSRVLLTGGAGFVGGAVARLLRSRGDEVVAVVRDVGRASALADIGCELVSGDLSTADGIAAVMEGCDSVIHAAGSYRVGILPEERPAMLDANEGTTRRVLEAAAKVGVGRVVVVSTVGVFGNTRERVVDETYRRDPADGYLSFYDESKHRSHLVAEAAVAAGQPVVIVQPSQVYGPGDHSSLGGQLADAAAGRLRYRALDSMGVAMVHVDDLAAGIVAALDRGRIGEAYVLAGPPVRMRDLVEAAAAAGGRRAPRWVLPTALLRVIARLGPRVARAAGSPPNVAEVVRAADGVTYWASSAKAERELGFRTRTLEQGFAELYERG